jgi:alkylation response protein AidB-like acyl-CoA dehydrogenase
MNFQFSDRAKDIHKRALEFAQKEVAPAEAVFEQQVGEGDRWAPTAIVESLKKKARAQGLWNLFLPDSERGGEKRITRALDSLLHDFVVQRRMRLSDPSTYVPCYRIV